MLRDARPFHGPKVAQAAFLDFCDETKADDPVLGVPREWSVPFRAGESKHALVAHRLSGGERADPAAGPVGGIELYGGRTAARRALHFRQLFATAALPFQPSAAGNGFLIRAAPQECDLFIRIRRMDAGTAVQVTCTAGPGRDQTRRALEPAEESHRGRIDSMEKYDRPVYPQPTPPIPPLP